MNLFRTLLCATLIVAVLGQELELPQNKTETKPQASTKPKLGKTGKTAKKKPRQYQPSENLVKFMPSDAFPIADNPLPANYIEEQTKWARDGHHHHHHEPQYYAPSTTSTLYYPPSTTPKYYSTSTPNYEPKPVYINAQSYDAKPSYEAKPSYDAKPYEAQPTYTSASQNYEAKPSYPSSSPSYESKPSQSYNSKPTSYSSGSEYAPAASSYSSGSSGSSYTTYSSPSSSYSASYSAPQQSYSAPSSSYGASSSSYSAPSSSYGAPSGSYGAPSGTYGAPSYDSQPYNSQYYYYSPIQNRPFGLFSQLHGQKKPLILWILVPIAVLFIGLPILGLLFSGVSTTTGIFNFGRSASGTKNLANWEMLDIVKEEMYNFLLHNIENLEEEKCMERVMCYLGTYAYDVPGKPYVLNVMESLTPSDMTDEFDAFNKAAIYGKKGTTCEEFTCAAIDKISAAAKEPKEDKDKTKPESNLV